MAWVLADTLCIVHRLQCYNFQLEDWTLLVGRFHNFGVELEFLFRFRLRS